MRVKVYEEKWVEMDIATTERIEKLTKESRCLACEESLGDSRVIRGLHEKCYIATRRAVVRGSWTEEQRVASGKLLPAAQRGAKPTNPVSVEASRQG